MSLLSWVVSQSPPYAQKSQPAAVLTRPEQQEPLLIVEASLKIKLCNFIAVFATTHEIYPKFHSFPYYYIYKLTTPTIIINVQDQMSPLTIREMEERLQTFLGNDFAGISLSTDARTIVL